MLNVTNYSDHPSRHGYTIFRFYEKERAAYFEQLLNEETIWFETDIDNESVKTTYFFGVKNSDFKKVQNKNFLVNAKYREPFIPNSYLRWTVVLFALGAITLSIVGYFSS